MSLLSTLRTALTQNQDTITEPEIAPAKAYEVLRTQRRRWILEFLATKANEPVPAGEIADHLSVEHCDDRTAVYVSLLQTHLPMMADVSVIEYNQPQKLVSLTTRGDKVLELHQSAPELLAAKNSSS